MPLLQNVLDTLSEPFALAEFVFGVLVLGALYTFLTRERPYAGVPVVTLDPDSEHGSKPARLQWIEAGHELLAKGLKQFPSCFQVLTPTGYKVLLPNRFADELRNHPDADFKEAFSHDLFINYPGFDGLREGLRPTGFVDELVRVKLTQSLGLITGDIVEEADQSMREILGEPKEWQTFTIKEELLDIVARLSSRVFLGKELCENKDWLRISKEYTVDLFEATRQLGKYPALLRPLAFWFIPSCSKLTGQVREARKIIMPEVERRRKNAEEALRAGKKPPKKADAIGWTVEISKGRPVDLAAMQLSLSNAAIFTTSETLSNCITQLCEMPELQDMLRTEIVDVLKANGWSKVTLYKMRLLDSFLKEISRARSLAASKHAGLKLSRAIEMLTPCQVSLNRKLLKPITLSDGTFLARGTRILVSDDKVNDPDIYPDPAKFDVARYSRQREQSGEENHHQFVTTSSENMNFGHGKHACPGRFFASNELKIALCFLLVRYDMRFVPGEKAPDAIKFEIGTLMDPRLKVQLRKRNEEVDLASPDTIKA